MKKTIAILVSAFTFTVLINSCSKTPYACFKILNNVDSIHVRDTVRFDANCSSDVDHYNWNLGDNKDLQFNATAKTTYDTVGTFNITLFVTSGGNTAQADKTITVRP